MYELPDGSGFFVGSLPLPKDHWLYAPKSDGWDSERDCPSDTPLPILDNSQREAVTAALRWAVRGATINGTAPDFDPDALVLNAVYALCGPCGTATPNAIEMHPHQQRVVDEKTELDARREKLGAFKNTDLFAGLPWQEQERLNTQGHLMTMYSAVLGERIRAFEG